MELVNKRILIVRLGAIGDVIRTLPALRALRNNLPEAYIAWVVEDRADSLLEDHPDLDAVFIVPRKKWVQNRLKLFTIKEVWGFIRSIRRQAFDVALDFHSLFKSGLVTLLSGAPVRAGFSRKFSREGSHLFMNRHVSLPDKKINRVERNLLLVQDFGLDVTEHDPIIPISPRDREFVDTIIPSNPSAPNGPRILIHPGSSPSTPYKRWEWRRFAQLADMLIQKYGGKIFFTAGADERELVKSIVEVMKESHYVLCRTETLTQLAELMRRCDLYIGNDTAPMHLASFIGTPVIALFGPTDPIENAPYGKAKSIILRKDFPCSPCRKRECDNLLCMDAIAVEDVLEAIEQILPKKGCAQTQNAVSSNTLPL